MSVFCIVSEFNPLHNGHEFLLRKARELGAEKIVCIMSGNATQRGELAITDKYLRAQAAVECGADLVLELPFPWCSSSADFFAVAAVSIAACVGDTLFFGSECADTDLLRRAAECCEGSEFGESYARYIKSGQGSAAAYIKCLSEHGFEGLGSNDLLGIAYIRAIVRLGVNLKPLTMARRGADYNSQIATEGEYPSAGAVRKLINSGEYDKLEYFLPPAMTDIIKHEAQNGTLTDIREADAAILGFFRLCEAEQLENTASAEGGLSNRLISAARQSSSTEEMFECLRTKRYTDAKLRRAVLFSLTSVKAPLLYKRPEYTTLLACNSQGREILSSIRKKNALKVITKPADAPSNTEQYHCSQRLDDFYGLARKKKLSASIFLRKKAYVVK